jgi:myo-inositol-1(or 4)-monophosphatase
MALRNPVVNVMVSAAHKAARRLLRDFGEVENLQVSQKGPGDFVTEADRRTERMLKEELGRARPDFGFLVEESGETPGRDPASRWIVDPLDGTTNFLHGLPHFAISIGLEQSGEITAGVVYDPLRDETFWAQKGGGAYVNARRLRVSARKRMSEAVLATGIPFGARPGKSAYLDSLRLVMDRTAGVRRFGSAALDLAYVAAGRYEGFWELSLSPWDVAAGMLLVREAGGFVSAIEPDGDPVYGGGVLASNDHLHEALGALIRPALLADAKTET